MTKTMKSLILMMLLTLFFHQCAYLADEHDVKYAVEATVDMQQNFNIIERQYRRKELDKALAGYKKFVENYDHSYLTDEAIYKTGKIYLLKKEYESANVEFHYLAKKTPDSLYKAKGQLMAAYASFLSQDYKKSLRDLEKIEPETLSPSLRVQYHSLQIFNSQKLQDDEAYTEAMVRLFEVYNTPTPSNLKDLRGSHLIDFEKSERLLDEWIAAKMDPSDIFSWMKKYPQDGVAKAYINFKIAKTYFEDKNEKRAEVFLSLFLQESPKNKFAEKAKEMLNQINGMANHAAKNSQQTLRLKLGVLLPMQGVYKSYGESFLNGLQCGAGKTLKCGPDTGVEFIVKDSGETSESVVLAIEQLSKEKVDVIVGPMLNHLSQVAVRSAGQLQIPIFPVTQASQIMKQGENIFQIGFTAEKQMQDLANLAVSQNLKKIAIFHPKNKYGETFAELFETAFKGLSGEIVAKVPYNTQTKDLFAEVRKLKSHFSGLDPKALPFDAVFVPDSYAAINRLLPAFDFNELNGFPLLGTNAWHDDSLHKDLAQKFPKSFFVDIYLANSSAAEVVEFREKFSAEYNKAPNLFAALGYDVAKIIVKAGLQDGVNKIPQTLSTNFSYTGVTGIKGFIVGDSPRVESLPLQITDKGIEIFTITPPESPATAE